MTGFMSGQGDLDTSTGDFSVVIPVPDGPSRVLIIFIITDASDATSTGFDAPMAALDVFSNECDESYLTITLETDVEGSYIDMGVFEPDSGFWPVFDTGVSLVFSDFDRRQHFSATLGVPPCSIFIRESHDHHGRKNGCEQTRL